MQLGVVWVGGSRQQSPLVVVNQFCVDQRVQGLQAGMSRIGATEADEAATKFVAVVFAQLAIDGAQQRIIRPQQQAAVAIGPDAVLRVEAWKNELARTRLVVDEMAPLWNRLGESFGGALSAMPTSRPNDRRDARLAPWRRKG